MAADLVGRRRTGVGVLMLVTVALLATACTARPTPLPTPSGASASPTPGVSMPAVMGPDPSYRVAAFYYPWYANPSTDGTWRHWQETHFTPPLDISSDYYPQLGAYSSADPAVVAQHMAWLRQAGVGVIVTSWWGPHSQEDRVVPLLLSTAARYGIKVAFHVEPFDGRSATGLVDDIKYIEQTYGASPAFFRTTLTSRYATTTVAKPMFFVWCFEYADNCGHGSPVSASYWRSAMDAVHTLPDQPLVIADTLQASFVKGAHVDGLYNYISLHLDRDGGFGWARTLPPGSLYVPSVAPGNSAQRVGYPADTLMPRQDGRTYKDQWAQALGTGVQPALVTVTSFNEWHEGSMIEPPAVGATNGSGYTYATFGSLPPDGYLSLTRDLVTQFLAMTWPATYRVRIHIRTTSDFTNVDVLAPAQVLAPDQVTPVSGAYLTTVGTSTRFVINQPIASAESGHAVEAVYDLLLSGLAAGTPVRLAIERGNLGSTRVTVDNYLGSTPVPVATFTWAGITTGANRHLVDVDSALLSTP
jgi:glycoprotein endo-alpha-1,2-mannosidase